MLTVTKPSHASSSTRGFTIVELLIVIVVIAILAAITIVAYNGVQQRANNTATIDAASKAYRMIAAYVAVNNVLPFTSASATDWTCITSGNGCQWAANGVPVNSTFVSNMSTVGTMPLNVPVQDTARHGLILYWNSTWALGGVPRPLILIYWLKGINQQCGMSGVVTDGPGGTLVTSSTGYAYGNDGSNGMTICYITIPGPAG